MKGSQTVNHSTISESLLKSQTQKTISPRDRLAANTNDRTTPIALLREKVRKFVEIRNWQGYHNPKDLAIAISVESSELLDIFKWKDFRAHDLDKRARKAIEEETADVFILLLSLCNVLSIDLSRVTLTKMSKNSRKYPVKESKRWQ